VASHGRIPGLVTQDRPRAVKEPCRGHRRPAYPHVYGVDAGVSGTARTKPARSSRSRHRFPLRHSLCPATRPLAVSALPASVLTDRAMTCQAANRPQPKPEPVMAVPFPVMSQPGHSARRAPRSQTRPAAQPVYLCIAAVCGNARSCRISVVILAVKPIAGHDEEGDRREPRPGRCGCRRGPRSTSRSSPTALLRAPG